MSINVAPVCPYCKEQSVLTVRSVIRKGLEGKVYLCKNYPECNSYVRAHIESGMPQGSLANRDLRQIRSQCHELFDKKWRGKRVKKKRRKQLGRIKRGIYTLSPRDIAYQGLASVMNLSLKDAHIGLFNQSQCEKLLKILKAER